MQAEYIPQKLVATVLIDSLGKYRLITDSVEANELIQLDLGIGLDVGANAQDLAPVISFAKSFSGSTSSVDVIYFNNTFFRTFNDLVEIGDFISNELPTFFNDEFATELTASDIFQALFSRLIQETNTISDSGSIYTQDYTDNPEFYFEDDYVGHTYTF